MVWKRAEAAIDGWLRWWVMLGASFYKVPLFEGKVVECVGGFRGYLEVKEKPAPFKGGLVANNSICRIMIRYMELFFIAARYTDASQANSWSTRSGTVRTESR